ncbi:hypothetical protein [Feifania hominis]|uniref:Regulatory protein YycH-like domain-containing protein n=1 Tax=Feifania hominis TaxID=2763660 RepID=A0A926DFJ4_9FIRM|nr:hypothetical protein [Feifania hominis]MBC8536922.1 hypothetical protein [Feifania hominis]
MEWSKVKTILIVVLLVVNLFLGVNIVRSYHAQNYLQRDYLENGRTALSAQGLVLDDFTIPSKKPKLSSIRVAGGLDSLKQIGYLLLDTDEAQTPGRLERGETIMERDGALFAVRGQHSFRYEANRSFGEDSESALSNFLQSIGVEKRDYTIVKQDEAGGVYELAQLLSGAEVADCHMVLRFDGGTLLEASGTWIFTGELTDEPAELLDSVAALLELAAAASERGETLRPLEMELVYGFTESAGFNVTTLHPMWRVAFDGGVCMIDAVSGGVRFS